MSRKEFANIGLKKLGQLIDITTPRGRSAANSSTVYDSDSGLHLLQIPVRFYILLHFYANSSTGTAGNINIGALADDLNCNTKSIKAALFKLRETGFVTFDDDSDYDLFDLTITDVPDMYKKTGKGGKGYLVCGPDLLKHILGIFKINALRVFLRTLIQTTSAELTSASNRPVAKISMVEYRAGLPKYVKPSVVKTALDMPCFNAVFECLQSTRRNCIIRLRPEIDGKRTKAALRSKAREEARFTFKYIRNCITRANNDIAEIECVRPSTFIPLREFGIDLEEFGLHLCDSPLPEIDVNNDTLESCATLAQDFGIDSVLTAIKIVCRNVVFGLTKIKKTSDLGGLVRSIIAEQFNLSTAS